MGVLKCVNKDSRNEVHVTYLHLFNEIPMKYHYSHELPPEPSPVCDSKAELQMDIDDLPRDNVGMSDECPSRVGEDFLFPGDTVSDDEENAVS